MKTPGHPDLRGHCADLFAAALKAVAPDASFPIVIEKPKQAQHGDYACNVAMQLAKPLKRPPREIAARLVAALPPSEYVEKAEIAGPGFINVFLRRGVKQAAVQGVLAAGDAYGTGTTGREHRVQVEFVSANPTGPLHVGHGRGAAYGASISNILAAAGYEVTREYYVNDAGRQMDILALSTWLRYLELHGIAIRFPENAYRGDYVVDMAQQVKAAQGARYVRPAADVFAGVPDAASDAEGHLDALIANAKTLLADDYGHIHAHALNEQLADCRDDLTEFGVVFDRWFSERSLYDAGLVHAAMGKLERGGHIYQREGAKWFRSTEFGDEKDRVVQRENGQYTYFASDIAYHLDKFERQFDRVIDV